MKLEHFWSLCGSGQRVPNVDKPISLDREIASTSGFDLRHALSHAQHFDAPTEKLSKQNFFLEKLVSGRSNFWKK